MNKKIISAGITRAGLDKAGDTIIQGAGDPTRPKPQLDVYVNGHPAVRIGDAVKPHGKRKHRGAKMMEGSSTVFINGIGVSRAGDKADCDHPATGSTNVIAG